MDSRSESMAKAVLEPRSPDCWFCVDATAPGRLFQVVFYTLSWADVSVSEYPSPTVVFF